MWTRHLARCLSTRPHSTCATLAATYAESARECHEGEWWRAVFLVIPLGFVPSRRFCNDAGLDEDAGMPAHQEVPERDATVPWEGVFFKRRDERQTKMLRVSVWEWQRSRRAVQKRCRADAEVEARRPLKEEAFCFSSRPRRQSCAQACGVTMWALQVQYPARCSWLAGRSAVAWAED